MKIAWNNITLKSSLALLSAFVIIGFVTPCYGKTIKLAWDANAEPDLAGYRVYYKIGDPDPPYDDPPINIALEDLNDPAFPEYEINIPDDDETWFFAVSAYDEEDLESTHSTPVCFSDTSPNSLITSPTDGSIFNTLSFISGISCFSYSFEVEHVQIMVTDGSNYLTADGTWATTETWFNVGGVAPTTWTHDVSGVAFTTDTKYTIRSRAIDDGGIIETPGMGIEFTYDKTNPFVENSNINFVNKTIDITFSEGNIQRVTEEASYSFSPVILFATPGGSDNIINLGGNTYRLEMASISAFTIFTLQIQNITDAAGNEISPRWVILNDSDQDRLPDDWETVYGVDDPAADPDGDTLTNLVEFFNGTDPMEDNQTLPDLDGDGLPDIWEQANGLELDHDDAADDPDHDLLNNQQEYLNGTKPFQADSDHDSIGDGTELIRGTDPLDYRSAPEISVSTSRLQITDVTPHSFSLVWIANQTAACFANVYADPEGTLLIGGLTITDESANHPPAEENGVMKVKISGLSLDTPHYFQIITVGSEGILVEPARGELPNVRTEVGTLPVDNDLLAYKILQGDGSSPAYGALLLAEVEGARYPITGWVDDNIAAPWALVDLNNIYSEVTGENLELLGDEAITLTSIGGLTGFRRFSATVPVENGGIQALSCDSGECILDAAAPIIDTGEIYPAPGVLLTDNTPVITVPFDDLSDINHDTVNLVVDGMDVTDEATVDRTGIEYTPATTLYDGTHTVTLLVADEWGYAADPLSWTFKVDTTPPVVTINEPKDGDFLLPATQVVRWTIEEENLFELVIIVNDIPKLLELSAVEEMVVLEPGLNLIEVYALDQVGNFMGAEVEVTVDEDNDSDGIGDFSDPDDDNDLMDDIWETANGLDPFDPFDTRLDADGDGYSNLTEYTSDTNPLDENDYPVLTLAVDHLTVTDVTSDGFAVIWQTTEPSTCTLEVYDETDTLLSSVAMESESALHSPAEDIGVMKVRVNGLEANKIYRFQTVTTSKGDGVVLFTPSYPQLLEVVTESATAAVGTDSIKQKIFDEAGSPADGSLLVVSVEDSSHYPVTAWVGEGIASPWASVNLNRIYSDVPLLGGEELNLWSFGGQLGNYMNIQKAPILTGLELLALPDAAQLSTDLGHYLDLKVDLNVVGLPVHTTPAFTAYSLLNYLKQQAGGDETVIENIKRYNIQTGSWQTASWFLGMPAGVDFAIKAGEAYLIYMGQALDDVWFEGIAHGAAVDLSEGLNMVALPAADEAFDYTSYEMLADLGNETQVASIKRYEYTYGWQTTSWFLGLPAGIEYDARRGEGYLINMKEEKMDWRPF